MSHRGFSTIEAIAAIFIISFVLFASITLIIQYRIQSLSTSQRLLAFQVASQIKEDISKSTTYSDTLGYFNNEDIIVNVDNCSLYVNLVSCDYFQYTVDGETFSPEIIITFTNPSVDDEYYQVIHYEVSIIYHETRSLSVVGMIYE